MQKIKLSRYARSNKKRRLEAADIETSNQVSSIVEPMMSDIIFDNSRVRIFPVINLIVFVLISTIQVICYKYILVIAKNCCLATRASDFNMLCCRKRIITILVA